MARPTTKNDLIESGERTFTKLMVVLDSLSLVQQTADFKFDIEKEKGEHWKRDRNVHDVLIHLFEWHQLVLNWVNSNQKGENKQFLKEGYNWRTYSGMNQEFMENNKNSTYEESVNMLKKSHSNVMKLENQFSNDELFSKGAFPWVGGSTLGSYFVSVTSSHYEWAIKKINKHKKLSS